MGRKDMMLAHQKPLETFIEHIENNDAERYCWLNRIREMGLDSALSEFEQQQRHTNGKRLRNRSTVAGSNEQLNA